MREASRGIRREASREYLKEPKKVMRFLADVSGGLCGSVEGKEWC
jgi:hypothetical protein